MMVALVLRAGGEYGPQHVGRLVAQIEEHLPGSSVICLSDVDVPCRRLPLRHVWPRWWSKMELFAPWVHGDLLYMDLDSTVIGSLEEIAAVNRLTIMRDVYRPNGLQSSVMFLPESEREAVWSKWIASPDEWMSTYRKGGDQAFLEQLWLGMAALWQDAVPGQIVSYKAHVREAVRKDREFGDGTIPDGARLVVFHGLPRPWHVGW